MGGHGHPQTPLVILGGTFNPVHFGHLSVASQAAWQLQAPVHLMLSARPPHRDAVVTAQQRWAMLQLATEGWEQLVPDRRELDRSGPSYMVDTLTEIRATEPERGVVLILGSDAAAGLDTWHDAEKLTLLTHLLVIHRPGETNVLDFNMLTNLGFSEADGPAELASLRAGLVWPMSSVALEISASAIRQQVARGGPIDFMLPVPVANYVREHGLYTR